MDFLQRSTFKAFCQRAKTKMAIPKGQKANFHFKAELSLKNGARVNGSY